MAHYKANYRAGAGRELEFFANLPTLAEAVRLGALAKTSTGKRHPHHQRRTKKSLSKAGRALAKISFRECDTFDELIDTIDGAIRPIHGIGTLFVYDAALCIGANLGLEPDKVYLHAGTRMGARALGLGRGRAAIEVRELPKVFRQLRPHEIEDCLCLYKSRLEAIQKNS